MTTPETRLETDAPPIAVVKLGSSVLASPEDLPRAVAELYRYIRRGGRVVAVVSAFAGETDRLIALAERFGADRGSVFAPRFIASGEERAAALLAIACDQAGLIPRVATAERIGLRAVGGPFAAEPVAVDGSALRAAAAGAEVVIVPGFMAIGEGDEPVLLGRGGSDLTAALVADALGLPEATLLKDVDGVYDRDPAKFAGSARRFVTLGYETARRHAGVLVQPRAIDFAEKAGLRLRVARLGASDASVIGAGDAEPATPAPSPPLRVAMAGCGVIGTALADLLGVHRQDFELVGVLVRDMRKRRPESADGARFTASPEALFALEPDIVVDVLSSGAAGLALTDTAIASGVDIVSANKQAIADELPRLTEAARRRGVALEFGAAVGGGAPMIEVLRRARRRAPVVRIEAVVNGTVNFILEELRAGRDFDAAVEAAQRAGLAEADPSSDLTGADAVAKAKILAIEAFGAPVARPVEAEPLDAARRREIAASPGVWRQVTRIEAGPGGPEASIRYLRISAGDDFEALPGERNAIRLTLADGASVVARGRGAGPTPTAHSVLGDLASVRRRRALREGR